MEAVLGSLSHQDEDLLDACHLNFVDVSSLRRLRRRTPLGDMPRDWWIGWYSAGHTQIFPDRLVSRERGEAKFYVAIVGRLTVHGEFREGE
jgi:hypothetical protein